jgi:TP901 family phage tail tape measure protein
MATRTSQLIVSLLDRVSGPASAMSKALTGVKDAAAAGGITGALDRTQARIGAAIERNNAALDRSRSRVVDAVAGFYALRTAIGAPLSNAMSLEDKMADIAKVSGMSDQQLKGFERTLRGIAVKEIPMAVEELAALAAAASQSGIANNDLEEFTRQVAKSAVAWEMSGEETGSALAKIKTALGLTIEETARYADTINYLSDSTASSASDLVEFSRRVAADGKVAGFTNEEVLALGAAMISMGAQSDVAATSLRNVGKMLSRGAWAKPEQRAAFHALGIAAEDVAKKMPVDASGQLLRILEAISKQDAHKRIGLMSAMFGDEARALMPLLSELESTRTSLAAVADETNYLGSVQKEFENRARTGSYAIQRFKNQVRDLSIAVGQALLPAMKEILSAIAPFLLAMADFASANPKLTAGLVAVTGAFLALSVAMAGIGYIGLLAKGGMLQVAAGATGAASMVAKAGGLLAAPFRPFLTHVTGVFQTVGLRFMLMRRAFQSGSLSIGAALQGVAATGSRAFLSLLNPIALVRGAFIALRMALIATGIGAVIAGIAMAGVWIYNNWSGLVAMFQGIGQGLRAAFEPAGPIIDKVIGVVKRLFGWMGDLVGTVNKTEEEWRQLGVSIGTAIGDAINGMIAKFEEFIAYVAGIPERVKSYFSNLDLTGWIKWPSLPAWMGGEGGDASAPIKPFRTRQHNNGASAPAVAGARAKGGPVSAGQTYLVGEEGPELITPSRGGYVHASGTGPSASSGGLQIGSLTVSPQISIYGGGDPQATADRAVAKITDEVDAALRRVMADTGLGA